MSNECVIAEYGSIEQARMGLDVLETDDFTNEHVSVVTKHNDEAVEEIGALKSRHTDSPPTDGAVGVGAMAGGALATPLAVSTLIGPFMVAGPLAAMAAGAATGAILSSTDRWGVNPNVAADYEQRIHDGSVLVIVSDPDPIRVDDAERMLKTTTHESIERFRAE